jgi:hypothetical protein
MHAALVCFAALIVAAPAPVPGLKAKEELEALKKRLPGVVCSWAKEHWSTDEVVEVRVVRMFSPTQAKVVLMSRRSDFMKKHGLGKDTVFTIFLDFYDGTWSATRFDGDLPADSVRFLMLAIDEAAEKP